MRRFLATLLLLTLLVGLLAVSASAATGEIQTEAELMEAAQNGGSYALAADITISEYLEITADLSLDLQGHRVEATQDGYINVMEADLVLTDSVGGGETAVDISVSYGSITAENFRARYLYGFCSKLMLKQMQVKEVGFNGDEEILSEVVLDGAVTVDQWACDRGILNFDPTDVLYAGQQAQKLADGRYEIVYCQVEKTGEEIDLYFEDYSYEYPENNAVESDEQLLEVMYVNNGEMEVIPMTRVEGADRLWHVKVDKAYCGALADIYDGMDTSTMLFRIPTDSGMKMDGDANWYASLDAEQPVESEPAPTEPKPTEPAATEPAATEPVVTEPAVTEPAATEPAPQESAPPVWLWIAIAAAAVIAAVVVILVVKKKKAE